MSDTNESNSNATFLSRSYTANTPEELKQLYDDWAHAYDDHAEIRNSAQPKAVADMCSSVLQDKTAQILDVGAGTGLIGDSLKQKGFVNLSAFDPSAKMLEIAKQKQTYTSYHIGFLGQPLEFAEHSFDAITASGIFTPGHVDASVFPELNRILKPAGKMVFSLNSKLKEALGFKEIITHSEAQNWRLEQISPEFAMMDAEYSKAKAVIVVLSKQT